MKNCIAFGVLLALMLGMAFCSSQKKNSGALAGQELIMVTGKIIEVQNGKDGYTATLRTMEGLQYVVAISIINLQKEGGVYKRYQVEDTITVKGAAWKDANGNSFITSKSVTQ